MWVNKLNLKYWLKSDKFIPSHIIEALSVSLFYNFVIFYQRVTIQNCYNNSNEIQRKYFSGKIGKIYLREPSHDFKRKKQILWSETLFKILS